MPGGWSPKASPGRKSRAGLVQSEGYRYPKEAAPVLQMPGTGTRTVNLRVHRGSRASVLQMRQKRTSCQGMSSLGRTATHPATRHRRGLAPEAVVEAMLRGPQEFNAVRSFCEQVMLVKERSERSRESMRDPARTAHRRDTVRGQPRQHHRRRRPRRVTPLEIRR
jgi:hypothetical protein